MWFNSSLAQTIREAISCPDYITSQDVYLKLTKATVSQINDIIYSKLYSHWNLLYNFWKRIPSFFNSFNSNISASKVIPADLLLKIGPLFISSHILIYKALTLCDWYHDKGSSVPQIHVNVKCLTVGKFWFEAECNNNKKKSEKIISCFFTQSLQ